MFNHTSKRVLLVKAPPNILQDQLEQELDKHCGLLTSMTSLSFDLGSQLTPEEREKINKDRDNIKSRLDSLTNGKYGHTPI